MRAVLGSVGLVLVLSAVARAQAPFFAPLEREIPYGRTPTLRGDVDLDGDLDFLDAVGVLWNDGLGNFTPAPGPAYGGAVAPRPLALLDLDGDGDPDLLLRSGLGVGVLSFLLNVGGVFAVPAAGAAPTQTYASAGGGAPGPEGVFAVDLEPDGDIDLVLSDTAPGGVPQEIWRNSGGAGFVLDTGPFATAVATQAPYLISVRDLDGDGDADVFGRTLLGGAPNDHVVVLGTGGATALTAVVVLSSAGSANGAIADFDGIPPSDLILPGPPGPPASDIVVFGNPVHPGGFSVPVPTSRSFDAVSFLPIDLDGDGTHEIGRAGPVGYEFFDVPASGIGGSTLFSFDRLLPGTARAGDLDGDGDQDFVGAYFNGTYVVRFGRNGLLATPPGGHPEALFGGFRAVVADVESDGDADLVGHVLGVPFGPLEAVKNDGRGRFTAHASPLSPPPYQVLAGPVVVADFDADGDADLFEGGVTVTAAGLPPPRPDVLRLGTGGPQPTFGELQMLPAPSDPAVAAVAVDYDADGDLDVAVARRNPSSFVRQSVRLYANLGGGAFAVPGSLGGNHWTSGLVAADLDGDSDQDFVGAVAPNIGFPPTFADQSFIVWNLGGGVFADAAFAPSTFGTVVAALDFDGDGDVDLAFDGQVRLNVSGTFLVGPAAVAPTGTTLAALRLETARDFDADGFPDLLGLGGWFRNLNGIAFAPFEAWPVFALVQSSGAYRPAYGVADFDRDGDLDLVDPEGRILWNRKRHLSRGAPARIGGVGGLEIHGPPGAVFELFAAAGPAVPSFTAGVYGRVFLDLTTTVPIGTGLLGPTGLAAGGFVVPNAPALIGLSLWWQAVLPQQTALTGVEETPIVDF